MNKKVRQRIAQVIVIFLVVALVATSIIAYF